MTLVDTETGELIDLLTRDQAERLTTRIALKLDSMADTYAGVMPLIREAIERQAFVVLGYRSVGEYVADRFGGSLSKLGVEMRREVVRELTDAGMSVRAIAPVVGVSKSQVANDVSSSGHLPETPQGEATDGAEAADRGDTAPPVPRPAVTGIDGKEYKRPQRAPMRGAQRDKAETYLNLIEMQAAKAAREVQNLTPDQIRRVRPKADLWTVGLRNSIEVLQHLVDSLDPEENK